MGIRFKCPNGHRLNVKSFLAGKRGVCPHCGVSLRIPLETQPDPDSKDSDDDEGPHIPTSGPVPASPLASTDVMPSLAALKPSLAASAAPTPFAGIGAPLPPIPISPAAAAALPALPTLPPTPTLPPLPNVSPIVKAVPVSAPAPDPIADAPNAVWYVRPPSGGQYGPARGDLLRKWIAEGRVSGDSMVWREGWPDWLPAAPLFPSLAGKLASGPTPPTPGLAMPAETPAPSLPRGLRRDKKSLPLAIVVLMAIVSLFLIGVLALAIFNK